MNKYTSFLEHKSQVGGDHGFKPLWTPDFLFDFQHSLVEWALKKGRGAIFADCGLGKTPMQLVWAENVIRHTNKPVLIVTPLAVGWQTVKEGEKFGVSAIRSQGDGVSSKAQVIVTNYERLHHFNPADFGGMVCDESSILKNFDGAIKAQVTDFMRKMRYRLLCTATAAPNDYVELGTSSEALGEMGYMDMLSRFFKNDQNSNHPNRLWSGNGKWRFRGHAERDFWRWVCSWARAVRSPSDLGFDDDSFVLPALTTAQHVVSVRTKHPEFLFSLPAHGLQEERDERRRTVTERCEKAAEIVMSHSCSVVWCNLNDEGDLLERIIPDSVQVSGSDSDDAKEDAFIAFQEGRIKRLITKPQIASYGLNWQHCAHQTFFPSHSFEQWYQGVRRSWRFGQTKPVHIDVVTSEGESRILANLQRKQQQANTMFSNLVSLMNNELYVNHTRIANQTETIPSWL